MQNEFSRNEYEKLKNTLNYHNYRYHVLDDPEISDAVFDQMLKQCKMIEQAHPEWITLDSPTQRSGAPPAAQFRKVTHPAPILSLANAFSEAEVQAWFERILKLNRRVAHSQFVLEPKIDGLTVILHYRNGVLRLGTTRGDGVTGEDITENIRTIRSVPLRIPVKEKTIHVPDDLAVRAEAFIAKADFEKLNRELEEKGEKTYQNPRNTAAGSLRQLDSRLVAVRPLTILAYSIVTNNPKMTQWETLQFLQEVGFPVSDLRERCESINEVIEALAHWQGIRDTLSFETDGVVIKINDLQLSEELGFVGKDPRGAIAYKFPGREVATQLKDIGVNVGRTGVLTPFAVLQPVEIGGVIVRQATLHNFDYIAEKDIRIGDTVMLKRSGDVIPYVIGPLKALRSGKESMYEPPKFCPVCHQPVKNFEGEVAWYCVNASCPAQIVRNIEHFVSRSAMDIVGLGIKIVEQLVKENIIHDVADLYALEKHALMNLEGFADKKADNILHAIHASKNQPLSRLIYALGIRGIGEVAAQELARKFRSMERLMGAGEEEIQTIEGFGPNMASAVVEWFNNEKNRKILSKLKTAGVWPYEKEISEFPQTLAGKRFVVTGTLTDFTREEIKAYITQHGGKVSESVSKATDYLLMGENPGSKLGDAQTLGVKVINESELLLLAGNEKG